MKQRRMSITAAIIWIAVLYVLAVVRVFTLTGCMATRSVVVVTPERRVEVREQGWFYMAGEWQTVVDDQTATDVRTKSTIGSLGAAALGAAVEWFVK